MTAAPRHFHMLDALRGLASLSVVLWHYKMFYTTTPSVTPPTFDKTAQPFYRVLWPFYDRGFEAVTLFFVLSGFVIFFAFFDDVRQRRTGPGRYAWERFSRLYPLHLVTLLLVAVVQLLICSQGLAIGQPFNDAYHFGLNLLFASSWGLESGYSFNGPIWSVSVEVLLYAGFFLCAYFLPPASRARAVAVLIAALVAICSLAQPLVVGKISHAAVSFLAGGLAYFAWDRVARMQGSNLRALALAVALAAIVCAVVVAPRVSWGFVATFALVILSLAILQTAHQSLGRSWRLIGDITYSTYLLHFPIQLVTMFVVAMIGLSIDYNHPLALFGFIAAVIGLSVPTYYRFELPVKNWLRGRPMEASGYTASATTSASISPSTER